MLVNKQTEIHIILEEIKELKRRIALLEMLVSRMDSPTPTEPTTSNPTSTKPTTPEPKTDDVVGRFSVRDIDDE